MEKRRVGETPQGKLYQGKHKKHISWQRWELLDTVDHFRNGWDMPCEKLMLIWLWSRLLRLASIWSVYSSTSIWSESYSRNVYAVQLSESSANRWHECWMKSGRSVKGYATERPNNSVGKWRPQRFESRDLMLKRCCYILVFDGNVNDDHATGLTTAIIWSNTKYKCIYCAVV